MTGPSADHGVVFPLRLDRGRRPTGQQVIEPFGTLVLHQADAHGHRTLGQQAGVGDLKTQLLGTSRPPNRRSGRASG